MTRHSRVPVALLLVAGGLPASSLSAQAVRGVVFDETSSRTVAGAEVRALTAEYAEAGVTRTDATGRFVLSLDSAGAYIVAATAEGYVTSSPVDVTVAEGREPTITLALRPAPGVSVRDRVSDGPDAYVFGTVVSRDGDDPVEGAEVTLVSGADTVRAPSRWNGGFMIRDVAPGPVTVRVEHLAYAPEQRLIDMRPGHAYQLDVTLREEAIELPGIEVTVRSRSAARFLEPFFERMNRGLGGHFLTREDLERWPSQPVGEALSKVMSVRTGRQYGGFWRVKIWGSPWRPGGCTPGIFIDRVLVMRPEDGATDMLDMPTVAIEAIEVYPGPATLPPEYNHPGVTCAIGIWTRRGG